MSLLCVKAKNLWEKEKSIFIRTQRVCTCFLVFMWWRLTQVFGLLLFLLKIMRSRDLAFCFTNLVCEHMESHFFPKVNNALRNCALFFKNLWCIIHFFFCMVQSFSPYLWCKYHVSTWLRIFCYKREASRSFCFVVFCGGFESCILLHLVALANFVFLAVCVRHTQSYFDDVNTTVSVREETASRQAP